MSRYRLACRSRFDLHDLVAGRERPAEAFDLAITRGVQRGLQFDIERAGAIPPRFIGHSTWMSWIGLKPKRLGIRVVTSSVTRDRIVCRHEIEVAVLCGRTEIGSRALICPPSALMRQIGWVEEGRIFWLIVALQEAKMRQKSGPLRNLRKRLRTAAKWLAWRTVYQLSSASRFAAAQAGFLLLSQSRDRPDR